MTFYVFLTILNRIASKREKSHTTAADVIRINEAQSTGDWSKVHASRLYRLHSGEYCQLLEIIAAHSETTAGREENTVTPVSITDIRIGQTVILRPEFGRLAPIRVVVTGKGIHKGEPVIDYDRSWAYMHQVDEIIPKGWESAND